MKQYLKKNYKRIMISGIAIGIRLYSLLNCYSIFKLLVGNTKAIIYLGVTELFLSIILFSMFKKTGLKFAVNFAFYLMLTAFVFKGNEAAYMMEIEKSMLPVMESLTTAANEIKVNKIEIVNSEIVGIKSRSNEKIDLRLAEIDQNDKLEILNPDKKNFYVDRSIQHRDAIEIIKSEMSTAIGNLEMKISEIKSIDFHSIKSLSDYVKSNSEFLKANTSSLVQNPVDAAIEKVTGMESRDAKKWISRGMSVLIELLILVLAFMSRPIKKICVNNISVQQARPNGRRKQTPESVERWFVTHYIETGKKLRSNAVSKSMIPEYRKLEKMYNVNGKRWERLVKKYSK